MTAPTVTLLHGTKMPVLGLGTARLDDAGAAEAVRSALGTGYRLLDTAENYRNERGVGQGIRDAGVARDELFVTSKLNKRWHSVDGVREACENSLERLGLDYLDLFLIHWPNPRQGTYDQAWKGLVRLREEGLVRAAGVSNFKPAHLERIIDATGVVPDVNQINLNPYAARRATARFDAEHGIATEAWSPINADGLLDDPVITAIASELGRTPAQVVLRWITQQGYVTVPKSASPERQRENLEIFEFTLSPAQLEAVGALDRGEAHVTDSDEFGH